MTKMYDYLIFIGRFEPFHLGHRFVVMQALERSHKVILLIGSANAPRTLKNPFSFAERQAMIVGAFDKTSAERLAFMPIDDTLYNDHQWLKNIHSAVSTVVGDEKSVNIGVIGHHKDESSYYLSLFPNWDFVALPNFGDLSATPIRHAYFTQEGDYGKFLPQSSLAFLSEFAKTPDFVHLQNEYRHIQAYKKAWQNAPYAPIFVTTDALVVQAGHILLVERGGEYGRGLWALAGGFLDQHETLFECVVREVLEETGLNLTKEKPVSSMTFDRPDRSLRGRTLTTVFYFELSGEDLPDVAGGDDANQAFWLPLDKLDGSKMFEDHYSIIAKMLGL